jgi:CRP-like cAMP-binding protein
MPVLVPILRTLKLFDTLPADQLAALSAVLAERVVERREVVIRRGQVGAGLGFLIEGRLQSVDFTLDGREVGLHFIDNGDFFGELSVIDRHPAAEYVIAVAPSRIVFVDPEHARQMMFATPRAAESISLRLAERMRQVSRQRAVLALPSSFQRVCAQLMLMTRRDGGGQVVIEMPPTHQEIAIMVNTSRETVTRALQFLQGANVVARVGNQLVVHLPDTLQQAADGKVAPAKG